MSIKEYIPDINSKIHETSVDFIIRKCAKEVHIVQYDKTQPMVMVRIYNAGVKYILPDSSIVNLRFSKPDGTFVYKRVLGCDETRTAIYFDVDEQMTSVYGKVNPILELVLGSTLAGTSPIPFEIDRNPIQNGDIESKVDVSAIMDSIGEANKTADEALKTANEVKKITDNVVTKDELAKEIENVDTKISNSEQKSNEYTDSKIASIDLSSYVSKEYFTTTMENYVSNNEFNTVLKTYVTSESLNTILNNYVTNTGLNSLLSDYVTSNDLESRLSEYATKSDFTNEFKKYAKISYVDAVSSNTLKSSKEYTDSQIQKLNIGNFIDRDTLNLILENYINSDYFSETLEKYITKDLFNESLKVYAKIEDVDAKDSKILDDAKKYTDDKISGMDTSLYITRAELNNTLKSYITNEDMIPIKNTYIDNEFLKKNQNGGFL